MTTCASPYCEYPTSEGCFVCKICVQQLRRDLGDIPALLDDLNTTLSRQDRLGASGGRRGGETALAWKPPASEALFLLTNVVTTWCRLMVEHYGLDVPNVLTLANAGVTLPPSTAHGAARWLMRHVQSLSMHSAAGEAVDELASAVKVAYDVIDRPPDMLLAGQCDTEGCEEYLYVKPEATRVTCRGCGTEDSVDERRAWMMTYAADMSLPPLMCLSWIKLLMGKQIPRGTWDSWVSRKRISAHDRDHVGNPLYRFGDVRDLAADWVAKPRKEAVA